MGEKRIAEINKRIEAKIASVIRRTANDSPETLRHKLAIAELNNENAIEERDYLLGEEWKPVVDELVADIEEARRIGKTLDAMSHQRVDVILRHVINRLAPRRSEQES